MFIRSGLQPQTTDMTVQWVAGTYLFFLKEVPEQSLCDSEVLIITKGTVNRVISFLNPFPLVFFFFKISHFFPFPVTSALFDIHMCLWLGYMLPVLVIIWISKLNLF